MNPFEFTEQRDYQLHKASGGAIRFSYREGPNTGLVAPDPLKFTLTTTQYPTEDWLEFNISLGSRGYFKINGNPKQKSFSLPSHTDDTKYWVSWFNNTIQYGVCDEEYPRLHHNLDTIACEAKKNVAFIKFYNCNGQWLYERPICFPIPKQIYFKEGQLKWVEMTNDKLPEDALIGGFENEPIYIAQAYHNRSLCPGKYIPSKQRAYVAWGHREHEKTQFKILCGYNVNWIKTKSNYVTQNAFVAGYSEVRKEPLYIGRAVHDGHLLTGKIHLLYGACYLPYKGKEVEVYTCELLVVPDNPTS